MANEDKKVSEIDFDKLRNLLPFKDETFVISKSNVLHEIKLFLQYKPNVLVYHPQTTGGRYDKLFSAKNYRHNRILQYLDTVEEYLSFTPPVEITSDISDPMFLEQLLVLQSLRIGLLHSSDILLKNESYRSPLPRSMFDFTLDTIRGTGYYYYIPEVQDKISIAFSDISDKKSLNNTYFKRYGMTSESYNDTIEYISDYITRKQASNNNSITGAVIYVIKYKDKLYWTIALENYLNQPVPKTATIIKITKGTKNLERSTLEDKIKRFILKFFFEYEYGEKYYSRYHTNK